MLWAQASNQDIAHVVTEAEKQGQQPVPKLKELPARIERGQLGERYSAAAAPDVGGRLLLGVGGRRLGPVTWSFSEQAHLVIVGERASGKSTTVRTVAEGIAQLGRHAARMVMIDPRRARLGAVPEEMLATYAATTASAREALSSTVVTLRQRLPGPEVTPAQLSARDW